MNTNLIKNTLLLRQKHLQNQLACLEMDLQQQNLSQQGNLAIDYDQETNLEYAANRIAGEILQVKQVLKKLGFNSYGICQRCGGAIEEARLSVQPCTSLCIRCSQEH